MLKLKILITSKKQKQKITPSQVNGIIVLSYIGAMEGSDYHLTPASNHLLKLRIYLS
jgi:hypothetical protein